MTVFRRVLVLIVIALGLTACASSSDDSGGGVAHQDVSGAEDGGVADGGAPDADAGAAESAVDAAVQTGPREVVTTGSLTVVVADALAAVDDVVALVDGAGGRVDERSQQARTEHPTAWLTVRVPADGIDAVIADLEQLGEVTDMSISAEDVTRQGQDLDARIGALQASTDRLLELMVEAEDTSTLLDVERALSDRQADLESL